MSIKKLSKFVLNLHEFELDPYDLTGGGEVEVISAPMEGSLEEFELVKLRNEEDDDPAAIEGVQDLIRLSYLHEPAILHMLRQRFRRNLIYTNTGPILIAVVSDEVSIWVVCLLLLQVGVLIFFDYRGMSFHYVFYRTLSSICPSILRRMSIYTDKQEPSGSLPLI